MRLAGVSKKYGSGPWVLRDLDLDVSGLVVLTGGNGSGKSTLLRIVAGLLAPTTGQVLDRPASIGYVPERFPSDVRMSAQDYLRHMAAVRGAATTDVLDVLGFRGSMTAPMATLSKGNAQKVALAQAFAADLLVLDEPFSGLDAEACAALVRLLDGRDAVVADHEGHLRHGRVVQLSAEHVTIELSRVGAVDLSGLDGVVSVSEQGSGARVLVAPSRSDEVLAEVLRHGGSVRSVRS